MLLHAKIADLEAFVPVHEEHEDVARLEALTDRLETMEEVRAAIPALLRIFERFPHALFGSPGPVVHCAERAGLGALLPMLLQSFGTRPTRMTLWMVERCLRSGPTTSEHRMIIETLSAVRPAPEGLEFASDIDGMLEEHGRP